MSVDSTNAQSTLEVVRRFNEAFNRHDVDAVMAAMTDDRVFENTNPAPDGKRYHGQTEVRAFWEASFRVLPTRCLKPKRCLQPEIAVWSDGSIGKRETANRGTCAASISFACATAKWQKSWLT